MKKTINALKMVLKYGAYIYVIIETLEFAIKKFEGVKNMHSEVDIEDFKTSPVAENLEEHEELSK